MQRITGSKTARSFLLFILAVFFLFDLHGACVLSECPQLSPVSSAEVLNAGTAGRISPIRIPEKVSLREKVSRSWESLNKKEAEHIEFLLIYCILFSFLLLSRTGMSRFIPESVNLLHIRVLQFIHRADGKGPEDPIFSF